MPRKKRGFRTAYSERNCRFVRSGWSKVRGRWLYLYSIFPPRSTPFLPPDEALRTLVASVPRLRFYASVRFADRDHFLVYGSKENIFTVRADAESKSLRRAFMQRVAQMGSVDRELPLQTAELCTIFLSTCDLVHIEWTGRQIIGYSAEQKRYDGLYVTRGTGKLAREFQRFERVCKRMPPFTYGAAPWSGS